MEVFYINTVQALVGRLAVEKKPEQWIGRGNNPRSKNSKWKIKYSGLNAELKSGAVLLAYSSSDPTEPAV
ncbi:MAG: hypothetical protein WCF14_08960 [Nitrososphaeraceae archaeon]